MAEKIANEQDFGLPLALAADNYASLHQCLQDVHQAARQFHAAWQASRDTDCLAAAQGLDIKGALLNGLYTIRVLHKDWLSNTPFTSPESLAHVLPLFRHALDLCENRSEAVEFPINGLQPALAHLHKQVEVSLQSLEGGQWQTTAEGQWYAQRHGMTRGEPDLQSWPAPTQPPDALPIPFDGLAAQCRDLSLIVAQLQAVLVKGPASRQAGPRSFKSVLSTGQPAAGSPTVAPRQPLTQRTRSGPLRPAMALARTGPPDPAITARVSLASRHAPPHPDAVDPPFPAAAQALAARHGTVPVVPLEASSMEPSAVEGLQQKIDAPVGDALARAAEAAQATLAGFAQACDKAILHGDLKGAGVASYADLAEHCRDLQTQWHQSSLRLHMPELEMRMALYGSYEAVCATIGNKPGSAADALDMAGRLDHAARIAQRISGGAPPDLADTLGAFHKFCVQQRNELLREAVRMQVNTIDVTRSELTEVLTPSLSRSLAVTAACDVLLVGNPLGDPLPDGWDDKPDVPANLAPPEQDRLLAATASKAANKARDQYEAAITLPADAPERAAHALQARLAMLCQTERTARTAATTIDHLGTLSAELESAAPTDRRAIVRRHLNGVQQLAAELRRALPALDDVTRPSLAPDVLKLVSQSKARQRADLRLAARMEVSLKTMDTLLGLRANANQVRRRIQQGKEHNLVCDVVTGQWHGTASTDLKKDVATLRAMLAQHLSDEPQAMVAESAGLDTHATTLEQKIDCDKLLIRDKLLLDWGTKALLWEPVAGKPINPTGFMALKRSVANQPKALVKINMALVAGSLSSEHSGRYDAQLEFNTDILNKLRDLTKGLDTKQVPGTAAGSSNAQPSVAQLLGIPAQKGKPYRTSRPKYR